MTNDFIVSAQKQEIFILLGEKAFYRLLFLLFFEEGTSRMLTCSSYSSLSFYIAEIIKSVQNFAISTKWYVFQMNIFATFAKTNVRQIDIFTKFANLNVCKKSIFLSSQKHMTSVWVRSSAVSEDDLHRILTFQFFSWIEFSAKFSQH